MLALRTNLAALDCICNPGSWFALFLFFPSCLWLFSPLACTRHKTSSQSYHPLLSGVGGFWTEGPAPLHTPIPSLLRDEAKKELAGHKPTNTDGPQTTPCPTKTLPPPPLTLPLPLALLLAILLGIQKCIGQPNGSIIKRPSSRIHTIPKPSDVLPHTLNLVKWYKRSSIRARNA